MFFFCEFLESGKGLVPQLSKVIPEHCDAFGIQFIDPSRAFAAVAHQTRILQHPQMLGNGRARYRQARGKLAHRLRVIAKHLKNRQPSRVTERRESAL